MSELLTLEELDTDGAIREAADKVKGDTRASFFGKAVLAGGAFAGGAALLGGLAEAAEGATATDIEILNFALTLEYLELEFYARALERPTALDGQTRRFAQVVRSHEQAHVNAIKGVLGRAAVAKPTFDFKGTTENAAAFRKTAAVLERTGVRAYEGQAPRIEATAILKAALAIHTVEARHSAWIRDIIGVNPAPVAFEKPLTMSQVLSAVAATGFIVSQPTFTG